MIIPMAVSCEGVLAPDTGCTDSDSRQQTDLGPARNPRRITGKQRRRGRKKPSIQFSAVGSDSVALHADLLRVRRDLPRLRAARRGRRPAAAHATSAGRRAGRAGGEDAGVTFAVLTACGMFMLHVDFSFYLGVIIFFRSERRARGGSRPPRREPGSVLPRAAFG